MRPDDRKYGRKEHVMGAFELIGLGLLALFFSALVSSGYRRAVSH